ncbi:DUF1349 domain-containing protein [Streptococcus halotolerans]|uniref:DUF1349 domain-containing protein n=1 Tax=Streptococcus halotolerans TaxID=1814128 RepID=UPI000788BA24|nr:DUF1349 domain-containing protein [Streptococcus halotolerans]
MMTLALKDFQWTRPPKTYHVTDHQVSLTTEPHTDLWQKTYYHFVNDNAPLFQMTTEEAYFSFTVKTNFENSGHRFDQCGIILYQDSDNWIKGSIEYENERFQHLGSVVTNHGYSDWATTEIPTTVKSMWYRLSRREQDFCIESSKDGKTFEQMRICHLHEAKGAVNIGIYACSPEASSFIALFTDFDYGDCVWQAHNGQAPDEEDIK